MLAEGPSGYSSRRQDITETCSHFSECIDQVFIFSPIAQFDLVTSITSNGFLVKRGSRFATISVALKITANNSRGGLNWSS